MDNCGECCETFGILYCGLNEETIEELKQKKISECPVVHGMLQRVRDARFDESARTLRYVQAER